MKETSLSLDTLAGMAVFAHVVDDGGFSAAARRLGLSKSAVSKQVAALEDRLGARLLNRTTRRMSLTEAGAALIDRCRRVLAEVEAAATAVGQLQAAPAGVLRVNAPVTFGSMHLAPAIPEFLARHPGVSVDLTLNDRMVDLVEEGFDVAIRIARLADSSLVARKLAPMRAVMVASPAYLARYGTPVRLADLAGHECMNYAYAAAGDEWRAAGPEGEDAMRVTGRLRANNGEVLLAAALAGGGIAMLPTFIAGAALASGRLVQVLPAWDNRTAAIHAVWPSGRHPSPKLRAFVDFLAERFGPKPYWEP